MGWYNPRHCEKCQKPMKRFFYLELDSSTNLYHVPGVLDEKVSQGMFRFHKSCALLELRKSFYDYNSKYGNLNEDYQKPGAKK